MNQADFRINGVILAGGKGTRMQHSEKPLLQLGDRRVIDWILSLARPQVDKLVLNINRISSEYSQLCLPVAADSPENAGGPLAGIHAAMRWNLDNDPLCTHLACFPGDVPWFDPDFVAKLSARMANDKSRVGWLQTQLQRQPLFSLWDMHLEPILADALRNGQYSPMAFIQSQANSLLLCSVNNPRYYLNLNTPEDLKSARSLAEELEFRDMYPPPRG